MTPHLLNIEVTLGLGSTQSKYASDHIVNAFVNPRFPGDDAVVSKMIFDIVAAKLPNRVIDLNQVFISNSVLGADATLQSLAEVFDSLDLVSGTQALEIVYSPKDDGNAEISYRVRSNSDAAIPSQDHVIVIRTLGEKEYFIAAISAGIIICKNGGFPNLNLRRFFPRNCNYARLSG